MCWKECWLYRDVLAIAEQFLYRIKAFPAPHTALPVSTLRVGKKSGGDRAGMADPTDHRHIPHRMRLCSAIKDEERWGRGENSVMVFPSNHYKWWSPAFLEMTKCLFLMGNNKFLVLLCLHRQLLLCQFNCLHLNPWVFALLFFQFSPPPWGRMSQLALNYTPGLTHITPWASAHCNQNQIRLVWWIQAYWPLKFPDQWSKQLIKFIIELCTPSLLRNIWGDVTNPL